MSQERSETPEDEYHGAFASEIKEERNNPKSDGSDHMIESIDSNHNCTMQECWDKIDEVGRTISSMIDMVN
ncbi:hypothetical protein PoB_001906500 [Plakobranchus ocellatus]|uniref:Uncharacterized protein n=1 Tax=Plakobranchus ocellatus TaxID=259542 RepID=A0AAV3ZDC6_9GAST|nr:hypothetical protein PoB_001906500 [Plakobranchus ocellatus]